MIEFQNVSVAATDHRGSHTIVQPTTLQFTHHRTALIGANGSGKSTLARLINGLVLPTSGKVLVGRKPQRNEAQGNTTPNHETPSNEPSNNTALISKTQRGSAAHDLGDEAARETDRGYGGGFLDTRRDGAAIRKLVAFSFTNPAAQLIMPTAIEDVALSLRRNHPRKTERLEAAQRVLDRFGLAELADRSVHSLSGGQQQLLALASVLATDPEILVADEPTTLLDLRNSRLITEVLMNLPQQLIVATHDLELAAACDRVLVVSEGRIVRDSASPESWAPEPSARDSLESAIHPGEPFESETFTPESRSLGVAASSSAEPRATIDWYRSAA